MSSAIRSTTTSHVHIDRNAIFPLNLTGSGNRRLGNVPGHPDIDELRQEVFMSWLMRRSIRTRLFFVAILCAVFVSPASAVFIDELLFEGERNWDLRMRAYSEASIRLENSQVDTFPRTKAGQLVSHRNFANPELDVNLTSYLERARLNWFADDLRFRVTGWGFYDGVYDYGANQFGTAARTINSTVPGRQGFLTGPKQAWFLRGDSVVNCDGEKDRDARTLKCGRSGTEGLVGFESLNEVFGGYDAIDVREIYGYQARLNELYLNYSKGPVFLRIGKQYISWGEADTIALLDQNNPFDLTRGAAGLFQDIEEARIPLWTIRGSLTLFDQIGPLSSGFVEAYWVPGAIVGFHTTVLLVSTLLYCWFPYYFNVVFHITLMLVSILL